MILYARLYIEANSTRPSIRKTDVGASICCALNSFTRGFYAHFYAFLVCICVGLYGDASEKKRYQRITWMILGALLGASIISSLVMFPSVLHICATAVAIETVLALLGRAKEKRRQNLEDNTP